MPVKPTKKLSAIFSTCREDTLSPKETQLITLAAQLALCRGGSARETLKSARSAAGGATLEEIRCAACHSACASGPSAEEAFLSVAEGNARRAFAQTERQVLEPRTDHLVALAVCLVTGCDCAAGHIVEARKAGVKENELARAACLAACVGGFTNQWRFGAALQCAQRQTACAC